MASILIVYSTTDGHTRKICQRLCALIEADGQQATMLPLGETHASDLARCDKIVVGASIRYGRHDPRVHAFVDANAHLLDAKPNAFFSVNIVARKPDKNRPESNPYLKKFLRQIRWRPQVVDVFAGKLDYPRYGTVDRLLMRLIMWLTHGPTDPAAVVEFTDWPHVDAFARRVARL